MQAGWIIVAMAAGTALGIFYFAGLWLTVGQLLTSRRPALLLVGSFVLRAGIVVFAFYLMMGQSWERLLACLAGFLLARTCVITCLRGSPVDGNTPA